MKSAATLLVRLIVIVLIEVWTTVVALPLAQIVKDTPVCCVECKKNYCPVRKEEAEPAMLCHTSSQPQSQCQIRPTCNHSMDQDLVREKAILITWNFSAGYSSQYFANWQRTYPDPLSISPGTPPPRIA